jgi:hypothetical protein
VGDHGYDMAIRMRTPQIRKDFTDKEAAHAESATENSLSKSCRKWMTAACTKFDDVQSINKVAEVQAQVSLLERLACALKTPSCPECSRQSAGRRGDAVGCATLL